MRPHLIEYFGDLGFGQPASLRLKVRFRS
jgi:hypothetical protein